MWMLSLKHLQIVTYLWIFLLDSLLKLILSSSLTLLQRMIVKITSSHQEEYVWIGQQLVRYPTCFITESWLSSKLSWSLSLHLWHLYSSCLCWWLLTFCAIRCHSRIHLSFFRKRFCSYIWRLCWGLLRNWFMLYFWRFSENWCNYILSPKSSLHVAFKTNQRNILHLPLLS